MKRSEQRRWIILFTVFCIGVKPSRISIFNFLRYTGTSNSQAICLVQYYAMRRDVFEYVAFNNPNHLLVLLVFVIVVKPFWPVLYSVLFKQRHHLAATIYRSYY